MSRKAKSQEITLSIIKKSRMHLRRRKSMVIFPEALRQLGFQLQYHRSSQIPYLLPPLCIIPAGTFLMGSDPAVDEHAQPEEYPQHSVWLPTYSIGKYPVTVAEYACAMQAQAPGVMMPSGVEEWWEKQLMHPAKPVYGLTWYDALGYARWLEHMTDQGWRLPTEAEWEKAARGEDGRIYPWGNQWDVRNTNPLQEEDQSSITPIDTYMHAASPYGVIDLVSNVAEWTSTIDDDQFPYPYMATDGREDMEENSQFQFRRLRGGQRGWSYDPPMVVRTAFRGSFHVSDRYDWLFGVRLVCTKTP
jgi:formylglycine-generating enzyme required for sulfatase activity